MSYNLLDNNNHILSSIPNLTVTDQGTGITVGLTTDGLGEIFQNLTTVLANSIGRMTTFFTGTTERIEGVKKENLNEHGKELYKLAPELDNILTHGSYVNVAKLKVSTIVGLRSYMLDVSNDVVAIINKYGDKIPVWLTELEDYLTLLVTTPDSRTASRPVKCTKDVSISNKEIKGVINKHINPKEYSDTKPIEKLYQNMYSIGKTYDCLLLVSTATQHNRLVALQEMITRIAKLSNDIYNKVKVNEITELSKATLHGLGYLLEENAKLITNYITVVYLYNELVKSLSLTIHRIK